MKVIYLLIFLFMMGTWLLDVSITTLNLGGVLTNGVYTLDPEVGYHLGLGVMISSFMILVFYVDYRNIFEK